MDLDIKKKLKKEFSEKVEVDDSDLPVREKVVKPKKILDIDEESQEEE